MPNLDLSDDDVLDAMRHCPGYLDMSTLDFREIYGLAHRHALDRLFHDVRAGRLMPLGIEPLRPDATLVEAARELASQDLKSLPVVDETQRVMGVLTETDFLRRLRAAAVGDGAKAKAKGATPSYAQWEACRAKAAASVNVLEVGQLGVENAIQRQCGEPPVREAGTE